MLRARGGGPAGRVSRSLRTRGIALLSVVLVGIGIVVLVQTVRVGGQLGYLLGTLFIVAGVLRLYLSR